MTSHECECVTWASNDPLHDHDANGHHPNCEHFKAPNRHRAFVRELFQNYWENDCGDIDAEDLQGLGVEHGVIEPVPFDPEKHGNVNDAEPGDTIYVLTDEAQL